MVVVYFDRLGPKNNVCFSGTTALGLQCCIFDSCYCCIEKVNNSIFKLLLKYVN